MQPELVQVDLHASRKPDRRNDVHHAPKKPERLLGVHHAGQPDRGKDVLHAHAQPERRLSENLQMEPDLDVDLVHCSHAVPDAEGVHYHFHQAPLRPDAEDDQRRFRQRSKKLQAQKTHAAG